MEMEIGNGNGNAPIAGAWYCARHRIPRGDGTACMRRWKKALLLHETKEESSNIDELKWKFALFLSAIEEDVPLWCICTILTLF